MRQGRENFDGIVKLKRRVHEIRDLFTNNMRFYLKIPFAILLCATVGFGAPAVATDPACYAPLSRTEVRQITRIMAGVTNKPILMIMGFDEDHYVPGAVTGYAYRTDLKTGKTVDRYTRTDLVSVIMHYTDRSHVDTYTLRKKHGRWRIQSKQDGSL
jgi:hypothetical protein